MNMNRQLLFLLTYLKFLRKFCFIFSLSFVLFQGTFENIDDIFDVLTNQRPELLLMATSP